MHATDAPDAHDLALRPDELDRRRAMLGFLLQARRPVTIAQVVDHLTATCGPHVVTGKRVADMLRYQVGLGRVRRVARGTYEAVPGAIPRATAWRCVNWRKEQARRRGRSAALSRPGAPDG